MRKFLASVALATAVVACSTLMLFASPAKAATVTDSISGTLSGGFNYAGNLTLDVVGGQVISGGGNISIFGLSNAVMAFISPSALGNEASPPFVGYRGNDGTDLCCTSNGYPIDTNGLMFDVGTNTAVWGAFPLFGIFSNGDGTFDSFWTGSVNNVEHFFLLGTASVTATPLPSTWTMLIAAFAGFGFLAYRGTKKSSAALAAA